MYNSGMEEQTFLTIEEVAELLKVTKRHVKNMIVSGKLPAKNVAIGKFRKVWRVLKSDTLQLTNDSATG